MARLTVSWWPRAVIAGNRSKPHRRRGLHWGEEEADGLLSDEVMEVYAEVEEGEEECERVRVCATCVYTRAIDRSSRAGYRSIDSHHA